MSRCVALRCEIEDKECAENKIGENESSSKRIGADKSSLNVNSSFVINLKMSVLGVCYVCIICSFSCVLVYEY